MQEWSTSGNYYLNEARDQTFYDELIIASVHRNHQDPALGDNVRQAYAHNDILPDPTHKRKAVLEGFAEATVVLIFWRLKVHDAYHLEPQENA